MTTREQLKNAIGAHGAWKMRLKTAIGCKCLDLSIEQVKSATHCDFGKWLSSLSDDERQSMHAREVMRLHSQFHASAAYVAELAVSGKSSQAERALSDDGEFSQTSAQLGAAIMSWRNSL